MVGQTLPPSLAREGDVMLRAAINDFQLLRGCNVFTLRDKRLGDDGMAGANTVVVKPGEYYVDKLEKLACTLDALLVIAPENNDILFSLCKRCSGRMFELFNSKVETIKLTSNKYATYRYLLAHGIPQIPTCLAVDTGDLEGEQFVMKPIDGVGCAEVSLLKSRSELQEAVVRPDRGRYIFQPYIRGIHASLSLLCREGACLVLSCNEQYIREERGCLQWVKCNVNAFEGEKFMSFGDRLAQALPGLRGYIGVDIVITGKEILLVEVNPRLTMSYAGLRAALGVNPAELILECFTNGQLPGPVPVGKVAVMVDPEASCVA